MDECIVNIKERIFNFLFNTKLGMAALTAICITLFVLLLAVGYILAGCGLVLLAIRHEDKTGERPVGTHEGLGTVLLWPVALILICLDPD